MKKQLLLFAMILLPLVASAKTVEINGIYYNLVSKIQEAEVTKNPNKYTGSVVIPEKVTYESVEYSVTSIGSLAFDGCKGLTSITIPNSVTSIGYYAFWDCSGLTSITIPNSVTSIGDYAFYVCSGLTSVTIGSGVTSIGSYAFCDCKGLTSITIPNSVTSIGSSAFDGCSKLTSITIPNSVTSIEDGTFYDCSGLTSVTIPNSVTSIGDRAFQNCSGLTSVTIPNSVTSIGESAFSYCSGLTSVTIPNSVTSIGGWAFAGCSGLTSVTIGSGVTSIGDTAFYNCSGLTSITIGSGINSIGKTAFASCPELTDVTCYAENVPSTDTDAFKDSYIEYATLHVPTSAVNAYKAADPWKNFKSVVAIGGDTPEPPEPQKCEKPIISYVNGKLTFACNTEGVKFIYDIQANGSSSGEGNVLDLTPSFTVKVYASKEGYEDSDVATETINIIKGDTDGDGVVDIADAVRIVNFIVGKIPALAPRSELNLMEPE